jgi:protein ImuA
VTPVSSALPDQMPGLGFPRWEVELLKVKNGNPEKWIIQWSPNGLEYIAQTTIPAESKEQKRA